MTDYDDNVPPLHPVRAKRIPYHSWVLAGIEVLPAGWVNVRMYARDEASGRDLYVIEPCPGILHFESSTTEIVYQGADLDGELFDEFGEAYDNDPVVVGTRVAVPPWRHRHYVDPTWAHACVAGGYLGTCTADGVAELLAEHGFADAIPLPEGEIH